jgi:hypothetical protein
MAKEGMVYIFRNKDNPQPETEITDYPFDQIIEVQTGKVYNVQHFPSDFWNLKTLQRHFGDYLIATNWHFTKRGKPVIMFLYDDNVDKYKDNAND